MTLRTEVQGLTKVKVFCTAHECDVKGDLVIDPYDNETLDTSEMSCPLYDNYYDDITADDTLTQDQRDALLEMEQCHHEWVFRITVEQPPLEDD